MTVWIYTREFDLYTIIIYSQCERTLKIALAERGAGREMIRDCTAASRETKARTGDDLAASRDWSADAPPNKHRSSPIIAEAP